MSQCVCLRTHIFSRKQEPTRGRLPPRAASKAKAKTHIIETNKTTRSKIAKQGRRRLKTSTRQLSPLRTFSIGRSSLQFACTTTSTSRHHEQESRSFNSVKDPHLASCFGSELTRSVSLRAAFCFALFC